tara:strand:+ start:224 stop:682 length:459 start_codon:yes stop_codon:yes gene_type:complete
MEIGTLWGPVTVDDTKVCYLCNEEKHISKFQLRSGEKKNFQHTSKNRRNECEECKSILNKQTKEARKALGSIPDNYKCPICKLNEEELREKHNGWKNKSPFVVDHDHETGAAKAYICQHCNIGLGGNGFNDCIRTLVRAIIYTLKHRIKKWN